MPWLLCRRRQRRAMGGIAFGCEIFCVEVRRVGSSMTIITSHSFAENRDQDKILVNVYESVASMTNMRRVIHRISFAGI
jgi:hypothetical protein